MGTWGVGYFENDAATEWLDAFLANPSPSNVQSALQRVCDATEIEIDDAQVAIAAAAIVLYFFTGEAVDKRISALPRNDVLQKQYTLIVGFARRALESIATDSELASEHDDAGNVGWRAGIDQLRKGIQPRKK